MAKKKQEREALGKGKKKLTLKEKMKSGPYLSNILKRASFDQRYLDYII